MKKKILGVCLLACLMLGAIACPSKNSPSNPTGNTPTPNVTSTPTNSPTNSPAVPTATPTNSATPCSTLAFQATYNFDSDIQCWAVDSATTIVDGFGISTTTHTGAGALKIHITNNSAATLTAQIEVNYTTPNDFSGAAVTAYVNADASLVSPGGGNTGVALFDQNTGFTGWEASYTGLGSGGSWIQIHNNATDTSVAQFGIQVYNIYPGASGNVYLDDVSITLPVGPTATPTSTPTSDPNYTWDFENNALHNTYDTTDSWAQSTGSGYVGGIPFVATPAVSDGSNYCLDIPTTFTGQNQLVGTILGFSTPINASAYAGLRMQIYIPSTAVPSDCYPGAQPQIGDGTTYPQSGWVNLTKDAWAWIDFPSSAWTGLTASNVTMIQPIINTGGSGTFTSFTGSGDIQVDNIEFY